MSKIRLDDGTILFEEEWLTIDALSEKIQKKIESDDMKFATIAAALEELKVALENSVKLDVVCAITKSEYDSLKEIGGKDDNELVRKAILTYIGEEPQTDTDKEQFLAEAVVPSEKNKDEKRRFKDHFLG